MAHKYLSFITDEHLFSCIENLHNSYLKAKADISKKKFYNNKIDTIKLTFDAKFNDLDEESLIKFEIERQIDKSINNSIGTFHEQILGGITGYEMGQLSGFDIKATNNTLFADIKNKHNTMNSSSAESLFQKLAHYADTYKQASCYWVQILAKNSFHEKWFGEINGKEYSHSRIFKISGDQFYKLLTGNDNAFFELYSILPKAIDDFLLNKKDTDLTKNSALNEISKTAKLAKRSILDEITFENYSYYLGFDKLK
ncbi:Eco47II family restriction endonuclease [Lutibacter sp. HS1-25]|uniref:Eco47II family restriction endonuclease n=1 Tax=Lutibacter sp. HS1-25 TaxID=2485000 RepID=UPI0010122509|nr:Eco47II family restriction endonuclease [Lutibacter sp. HS1-25]RXP45165.1 Eco47II family restriction endonuclease [Lutibacter sp. HS1-25]